MSLTLRTKTLSFAALLAAGSGSMSCGKRPSDAHPAPNAGGSGCATGLTDDPAPADGGGLAIYEGQAATASDAPSTGSLFYVTTEQEVMCTATLICPNVVLTAAHCFNDGQSPQVPATSYRFTLGPNVSFTGSADDVNRAPADTTTGVEVAIHPGWTGSPTAGVGLDMALLRLSHGMTAPLAALAFDAVPPVAGSAAGVPATAVGYGEASQDGSGAGAKRIGTVLFEGSMPADATSAADPGTLVTLRGGTGQDTCEGDSGGPLLINGKIYGTLSGGDAATCGAPLSSSVQGVSFYASVPNNRAWIQSQMQQWCGSVAPAPQTTPPAPADLRPCRAG